MLIFIPSSFKCWTCHRWYFRVEYKNAFCWLILTRSPHFSRYFGCDSVYIYTMVTRIELSLWGTRFCLPRLAQLHSDLTMVDTEIDLERSHIVDPTPVYTSSLPQCFQKEFFLVYTRIDPFDHWEGEIKKSNKGRKSSKNLWMSDISLKSWVWAPASDRQISLMSPAKRKPLVALHLKNYCREEQVPNNANSEAPS